MTVDETLVHYYGQRIKLSHQWVGPKKFKTQPSAGTMLATVFWEKA